MARSFNGSSDYLSAADPALKVGSQSFSFGLWVYPTGFIAIRSLIDRRINDGATYTGYHLFAEISTGELKCQLNDGTVRGFSSGLSLAANAWNWVGWAVDRAGGTVRFWVGASTASVSTSSVTGSLDAACPFLLAVNTAFGLPLAGSLAEIGAWSAVLSVDEAAALAAGYSPALIRPASLVAYAPLIGRSSPEPDLRGVAPLTLTGTSNADHCRVIQRRGRGRVVFPTTAAGGVLAGSCDISVTPSGVLLGAGALLGSAANTITPTATLRGSGALAGSAANAITPAGVLTGSGALLGSAAVLLTPTGSLAGSGLLAGSAAATLTPTGVMAGAGVLAGSAASTLAASASLAASGTLAGSCGATLTPTGTMLGAGALAGACGVVFTASATPFGSDALVGSAAVTLTPTGTLRGAGALSGSAAATLTPTGVLAGSGLLAGSSAVTLTPTGALAGSGLLAGSCDAAFALSATAATDGPLAGVAAVALALAGVLTAAATSMRVRLLDVAGDMRLFDSTREWVDPSGDMDLFD